MKWNTGMYLLYRMGRRVVFLAGFSQLSLLPSPCCTYKDKLRDIFFPIFRDSEDQRVWLFPNTSSLCPCCIYPYELTCRTTRSCLKPGQQIQLLTSSSSCTGVWKWEQSLHYHCATKVCIWRHEHYTPVLRAMAFLPSRLPRPDVGVFMSHFIPHPNPKPDSV